MKKTKRRKHKGLISVPVASMGDIAFLLIIFFIVASHFAQERGNIKLAKSPDAEKVKDTKITVMIDSEGKLYFQGREVDNAQDIEWGVRALVEGKTNELARTVMFSCDREIPQKVFEPIIAAIAKGGGLVAAVGEKAKCSIKEGR